MERGSWANISSDSDIWKKLFIGGACLITVLPIPVALGAVFSDLEAELEKIKSKTKPGHLVEMDTPAGHFGRGLAPTFLLLLSMMLFCVPTVVVLMSSAQTYAWIVSEHGLNFISFAVTGIFGLLALIAQFFVACMFPIAMAQYSRGLSIKPALDPLANFGYVSQMGAAFWTKASGFWLCLFGNMVLYIYGPAFFIDLVIRIVLCMLGFASLVVSSRYAIEQLQTKL